MKTKIVFCFALASTLPLMAVPRPDVAPRQEAALPEAAGEAGVEGLELGDPKKRGVGFLGVAAMVVPAPLAAQLKIDHGVALSRVVPDSPAAKADLEANDIILEVEDRKVASMFDLSDAIKAHREGDKVTLKLIQKGKRVEKKVTLAAAPPLPPGIPPGAMGMRVLPGGQFGGIQMGWAGGAQFRMGDGEGSVEMKGDGEGREVTVRDQAGEIVFEGPWVTPQDMAAPAPDVRKRIERVAGMFGGDLLQRRNFNFPRNFNLPAPDLVPPQAPRLRLELPPIVPDEPLLPPEATEEDPPGEDP